MPASHTARKSKPRKKATPRPVITTPSAVASHPRRLQLPAYKLFRFGARIKHPVRLPSVWQLSKKTTTLLWQYRWVFGGIVLIYGLLDLLLVRGFSSGVNVSSLKDQFTHALTGQTNQVAVGFSVFGSLLSSSGNSSSATAGAYQLFLAFIVTLATIWALRHVTAGDHFRLRDTFYKGMYPLIPFILVLLVVLLQALPFVIGATLYSFVITNGIAIYTLEKVLWGLLFAVLTLVSLYLICSSLFALYIVTLPDMTPLKALRSARQLVRYRRAPILRKLLFLPLGLFVICALIMIPIIIVAAPLAQWVFFVLSICALIVAHAYVYTLYKEMLV